MKTSKLITSLLGITAVVSPIGIMTSCSCSQTWGYQSPIAIGAVSNAEKDSPFYNFNGADMYDLDGIKLTDYLPSNYSADVQNSAYYAFYAPVQTWWTEKDGKKTKETDPTKWTNGSLAWYNQAATPTATITDGNNNTQTCYKNVALAGNTSFTGTIGHYVSKYLTYSLAYQASQFPNQNDFNITWGNSPCEQIKKDKTSNRDFIEWLYAISNSHVTSKEAVYLKTATTNFNYIDMPIPAYNLDKSVHENTIKLIVRDSVLGSTQDASGAYVKPTYYSKVETTNAGKENEYKVYTYPSVPVLLRTTNATQRWLNPKKKDSHFVTDYYVDNQSTVNGSIGKSWSAMSDYTTGPTSATINKYELEMPTASESIKITPTVKTGDQVDSRVSDKNIRGTDFIALITYYYTSWTNPDASKGRQNSVTVGTLSTVLPAYMLTIKDDLFTKINKDAGDYSGWMINSSKADDYSSEFLNLLNRSSKQGRIGQASQLSQTSKNYLQFLKYMFSKNNVVNFSDFVKPVKW